MLDTPLSRRYADAAERYTAVVRAHTRGSLGQFLRDVEPALFAVCSAASELPEVAADTEDVPESAEHREEYQKLQGSLSALLGRYDTYRQFFDPSDAADEEPVHCLLSLDLVEILEDLEYGRSLLEPSRRVTSADVLWQWRFGFVHHWGRHATSALRVINSLLYTRFVDALDQQ